MSSNIILNRQHIQNLGSGNNKLVYRFPQTVNFTKKDKIAMEKIHIYFSWFNITAAYNNNFFQYKFWNNTDGELETFDVKIPDGYYSLATLNEFFISVQTERGHYLELLDGSSRYYFIDFVTNATFYANEIRLSSLSENMSVNGSEVQPYTNFFKVPTEFIMPLYNACPELIFPSNNTFFKLMGFTQGSTIRQDVVDQTINETYSFLNTGVPQMEPSSSYLIQCNLCNNPLSLPNNILTSFTNDDTPFGGIINNRSDIIYSHCNEGTFNTLELTILDQEYRPLMIRDPDMLIIVSVIRN